MILTIACLALLIPFTASAATSTWQLWDWSAYIDGGTYNPPALPPGSDTFFDYATGMGWLSFSFNTAGSHAAGVYFNPYFDTGYGNNNTGYGVVHGAAPSGVTYAMDDPDALALWGKFSTNTLDNLNLIPIYAPPSGPPYYFPPCCNIGWAEMLSFTLNPGDTATVTFTVSDTDPQSGFYLEARDGQELQSIYLTAQYDLTPGPNDVPEPGTWLLIGAGLCSVVGVRRRFARK